jgi:hypothetical protein
MIKLCILGDMNTNAAQQTVTQFPKVSNRKRTRSLPVMKVAHKKSAQQIIAAIAAGFLPVASYVIAHQEAPKTQPIEILGHQFQLLWVLVAAALAYSAPTLVTWSKKWTGHVVKAIGFTVLLECTSVFSHIEWLNLSGLAILILINSTTAFSKAGVK